MSDDLRELASAITDPATKRYAVAVANVIQPTPPLTGRWFSDTAWPNLVVPQSPTIAKNSDYLVSLLVQAATPPTPYAVNGLYGNGLAQNGGKAATPVYFATDTTPTIVVSLAVPYTLPSGGQTSKVSAPLDDAWQPSPPDNALVSVETTGAFWSFESLNVAARTAHGVERYDLRGDALQGRNKISGLTNPAALIRPSEVKAGVIPHAVRGSIATTASSSSAGGGFVWPANHTDGNHLDGVPMGQAFWLPRTVALAPYDKLTQIIGQAMQEHLYYVSDTGGGASLAFESTLDGSTYPVASYRFPLDLLRQLKATAPLG